MQSLTLVPSKLGRLRVLTDRLLSEESMIATLFQLCPGMLCVMDSDLHIIQVNEAWERSLHWSEDQMVSECLTMFIHPSDKAKVCRILNSLKKSERTTFHSRFKTASGNFTFLEWNAILADDDNIYALATIIPQECFECKRVQKPK